MSPFPSRRIPRLRPGEFPPDWEAILRRNVPLYNRLPGADRDELHRLTVAFLAHKDFEGCGGQEITDEVRLTSPLMHACCCSTGGATSSRR